MEKSNVEQQKTSSAKAISSSKKMNQNDANLPGINYKTRYYLAAKKRHCSNYSANQSKAIANGLSRGFAKCPSCLKWFCSRESLNNHQRKFNHWTKQTGTKCPICHKNFLYLSGRNSHMQCHLHDEHKVEAEKFLAETTCGHCKKCFTNKQQKLKHIAEKHDSSKSSDLSISVPEKNSIHQPKGKQSIKRLNGSNSKCNTKVKSAPKLPAKKSLNFKSSKKPVLSNRVRCSFCPQSFSSPQNLNRHLRRKHHGVLHYQCSVCFSKFPSFLEAFNHKKKSHESGTVKKVIVTKSQKHGATESITKQAAEACSNDAPLPQADSTDASDAVPKGNRLSCAACNSKKFSCISALKRHENSLYHKKNVAVQSKTKSKDIDGDSDISILCSVCKEEFTKINGFVLHRMSHFVSDCDVASVEAETSYCYGCEICGDEIFGIKKVQFHLLWHGYTARCARKSSEVIISRPCSCGKSKSSARISLTCVDCKNSFSSRNAFVQHKKKCSNIDESVCLKYCIMHDTELCCSNDRKNHFNAKDGNGDKAEIKPDCGKVLSPVNSSHKEVELGDLTVRQLSQPHHVTSAPIFVPLTCSICRKVNRSLKEFNEHLCSPLNESPVDVSSKSQSASNPSSLKRDISEPAEQLAKRLRRRPNALADSTSHSEQFEHRGPVDSFRHNLSNLLYLLINDEKLMMKLGWGKDPIDVVVVEVLKLFGQETCKRVNGMTDMEVFRKNVHSLLELCLKDTVMQGLMDFDTVESKVKNVLTYLTIFRPSVEVRD